MSRFYQHGSRRDDAPLPPPEGRRRSAPEDDAGEPNRWQAGPFEKIGGSVSRTATAGCLAVLVVPLVLFLAVALMNGSWNTDQYQNHIERGKTLSVEQKLDEAMQEFQEARRLRPDSAEARMHIGTIYLEQERYPECEDEARAGLALDPTSPALHNLLGLARGQQGDDDEEFACYAKAIAVDPLYPTAHLNIGKCYLERREYGKGVEELETYLRLYPTAHEADKIRDLIESVRNSI
jgi:tetratricopeptide (TPR) repeat protein